MVVIIFNQFTISSKFVVSNVYFTVDITFFISRCTMVSDMVLGDVMIGNILLSLIFLLVTKLTS